MNPTLILLADLFSLAILLPIFMDQDILLPFIFAVSFLCHPFTEAAPVRLSSPRQLHALAVSVDA